MLLTYAKHRRSFRMTPPRESALTHMDHGVQLSWSNSVRDCRLSQPTQRLRPVRRRVRKRIRARRRKAMRSKAIRAANRPRTAVPRRQNIHTGVADHPRSPRPDRPRRTIQSRRLRNQRKQTRRIRLLGVKTVAAIVLEEKSVEPEMRADIARRSHWLVRQH